MIHPKVLASAAAAALTTVVVWGFSLAGVDVPIPVAGAFTTLFTFAAGWLKG